MLCLFLSLKSRFKKKLFCSVRDATGGGYDPDLDDSLRLTDAEEQIIAALGDTVAFNGIAEGEETGVGNRVFFTTIFNQLFPSTL